MKWIKVDSWHGVEEGKGKTLCGLDVTEQDIAEERDDLPGAKSCENCLRIFARRQDESDG